MYSICLQLCYNKYCRKEVIMRSRVRVVKKIGDGKYYTQSWKVSEYLIFNILYYILIWPIVMIIKWCFVWPIKKLIETLKSKDVSPEKKRNIIIIIVVVFLLLGLIGIFIPSEESNIDNSINKTTDNSTNDTNNASKGSITIDKFVEEYNKIAITKIKETHKVSNYINYKAYLYFDGITENAIIIANYNGVSISFDFPNGKEQIDTYNKIIKDCIRVFNDNLELEKIENNIQDAMNKNNETINIDDNIEIKYQYHEMEVGYSAGNRYSIEIISKNYNK